MDSASCVQILDETISLCAYDFEKDLNPSFLPPTMGKLEQLIWKNENSEFKLTEASA